jgi:hypothetical protein
LDWYEKKEEERSRKAGADMRKNMNSLKEGVWSMGTVTEINRFIKDIEEMKNHYYDIVGSDDVFDGLDRAQIAAEELAMNAPENSGDFDGNINEGNFDELKKYQKMLEDAADFFRAKAEELDVDGTLIGNFTKGTNVLKQAVFKADMERTGGKIDETSLTERILKKLRG